MKRASPHLNMTKALTGIQGFDEITDGGIPRGRTTLVLGGPGCGKTVFALQSLVNAVAELLSTTLAPGMTPPLESTTQPLSEAPLALGPAGQQTTRAV